MSDKPLRVLYLDDSTAALTAVSAALSAEGHHVRTATTVNEAAPWLDSSDIVIVDFHMPGINGAEALNELRERVGDKVPGPTYYLYTTDTDIALKFRAHGFHGAFTDKGNVVTLSTQLATAARLLKMRRFVNAGSTKRAK